MLFMVVEVSMCFINPSFLNPSLKGKSQISQSYLFHLKIFEEKCTIFKETGTSF